MIGADSRPPPWWRVWGPMIVGLALLVAAALVLVADRRASVRRLWRTPTRCVPERGTRPTPYRGSLGIQVVKRCCDGDDCSQWMDALLFDGWRAFPPPPLPPTDSSWALLHACDCIRHGVWRGSAHTLAHYAVGYRVHCGVGGGGWSEASEWWWRDVLPRGERGGGP